MNLWSFLFVTAVSASSSSSTQENKLIRVVVNNTESEPSPCLRAEFTAEVTLKDFFYKIFKNVFSLKLANKKLNFPIMSSISAQTAAF